ncbi:CAP domain-containing protein [Psychrobacter aestuarii]|uniref:CAP domain-containing protein n=1 Tax=Psychrobacter aestuarii TaxID=556327 RepID=A0ABP3FQ77_9GAMM|nr:CAP domain-containing protein [Psychrobacter aestuarii]
MMNHRSAMQYLSIMIAAVSLTACGGGGGSDGGSTANKTAPPPAAPTQPAPTDSIDSDTLDQAKNLPDTTSTHIAISSIEKDNHLSAGLAGANVISLARQSCGLSGLSYDDDLAAIAVGHANYIKHVFSNSQPSSFNAHSQASLREVAAYTGSNNPFFTGINFKERLLAAAYPNMRYGAVENIVQTTTRNSAGTALAPQYAAADMATSLLAAPYHLKSLMGLTLGQTGSAMVAYTPYNTDRATNIGYVFVNLSAGNAQSSQQPAPDMVTYPCDGVTNTTTALYHESPSPVAGTGRDLSTDPIGQPVYIRLPAATSIKVSNVRLHDAKRNIDVPTTLLDTLSDPHPNTGYALKPNEAFILPITDNINSCEGKRGRATNCGLHGNTTYTVSFDVLVDNTALKQQRFNFTTGAVSY